MKVIFLIQHYVLYPKQSLCNYEKTLLGSPFVPAEDSNYVSPLLPKGEDEEVIVFV
jgi:hypothetical protein